MKTATESSGRKRITLGQLELLAREVQVDLYRNKSKLWNVVPANLVDIFDPGVAVIRKGYKIKNVDSVGLLTLNGRSSEAVAELNNELKFVMVSGGFPLPVARFTLAHELGHIVLHPELEIVHRDLPLEKCGIIRDGFEIEANQFASCFLLPKNLVIDQFKATFGVDHLKPDYENSRVLFGADIEQAWFKFKSLRQITEHVARLTNLGPAQFRSLHSQFKVSPSVMAIRLEELGLVSAWGSRA